MYYVVICCCTAGDVSRYDEDGHVIVEDRIKELIKVKGLQVGKNHKQTILTKIKISVYYYVAIITSNTVYRLLFICIAMGGHRGLSPPPYSGLD